MQVTALSLVPTFLVLLSAIITRKLPQSILLGLLSGALIATNFAIIDSLQLIIKHLYEQVSDVDNLYVYCFLLCIGMLIAIINYTGAASTVATSLKKKIRHAKQAEQATFFMSLLLALDDYLNCLTVGHIMQPLTDSFGISRSKLAYLLHTFAGPLVILIPISTWAAFITNQIEQAGISNDAGENVKLAIDPFYVYLQSIPCIYYGIFTVITALFIIHKSISYGSMATTEQKAKKEHADTTLEHNNTTTDAHVSDLLIPLATLLGSVFFGLLYTGNYYLFGGTQSFIGSFQNNKHAFLVLGVASIITLLVSLTISFSKKQLTTKKAPSILWEGFMLMWPAVVLVILASALGSLLRIDLQTGRYLASLLLHTTNIVYVPALFFAVSAAVGLLIGSAWGTIALLLPIGISMAYSLLDAATTDIELLSFMVITIGAILSGATFGDHSSPIAASGIMAATGAGCEPLEHIQTQMLYNVPPFLGSLMAFLVTGLLLNYTWPVLLGASLITGVLTSISITLLFHKMYNRN
jgi:tetracycline resistance efflux pump